MSNYINREYCDFSNDASASSFGWNFQSNAGIFLFLKYLQNAEDIKIESKLQDIEITLVDGSKVLAQAKSSKDYTSIRDKKEKFKDAIISLARNPQEKNKLIYISNIPDTFKTASGYFDNSVVSYDSCLMAIKNEIDTVFQSTISSIDRKIAKESDKKIELNGIKKKVEEFNKSSLYISTINPFFGDEENRYRIIGEAVLSFLVDVIKINRNDAVSIKQKLLEHWQIKFEYNSTVSDKCKTKSITKADFAWPIIVFLVDDDLPDISDCLSFTPDKAIINEVRLNLESPNILYHERFEFSNKVIQAFERFKKDMYSKDVKQVEKEFIKKHGDKFYSEFNLGFGDDVTEFLTKVFLYRIICNNRNMQKISASIGVKI